jgi:hypothetical protein
LKQKRRKENGGKWTVKQLLLANAVALLALFAVAIIALWATGLLGSVISFIF